MPLPESREWWQQHKELREPHSPLPSCVEALRHERGRVARPLQRVKSQRWAARAHVSRGFEVPEMGSPRPGPGAMR